MSTRKHWSRLRLWYAVVRYGFADIWGFFAFRGFVLYVEALFGMPRIVELPPREAVADGNKIRLGL